MSNTESLSPDIELRLRQSLAIFVCNKGDKKDHPQMIDWLLNLLIDDCTTDELELLNDTNMQYQTIQWPCCGALRELGHYTFYNGNHYCYRCACRESDRDLFKQQYPNTTLPQSVVTVESGVTRDGQYGGVK